MSARILLVEDNPINLELARYLLGASGYEVLTAMDGAEALALARAQPPDLVISDIQMPIMDGYGLLRALRGDAGLRHLPVMALTASTTAAEEILLREAGFDAYLLKPFKPQQFMARVANLLTGDSRRVPPPAP